MAGAEERKERTVCAEFESVVVTCLMLASQICYLVHSERVGYTSRGASSEDAHLPGPRRGVRIEMLVMGLGPASLRTATAVAASSPPARRQRQGPSKLVVEFAQKFKTIPTSGERSSMRTRVEAK